MADLSFASMQKLFEDNWGSKGSVSILDMIQRVYSNYTILEYGKVADKNDEKEALEFGERAITNRIPFMMVAFTNDGMGGVESLQISEFSWGQWDIKAGFPRDYILLQKWDVDIEPSGLLQDETFWTEDEIKEYFNAKALQINVVEGWGGVEQNVRQDYVMIIYGGVLIPIPINFLSNFPLEAELRERMSDTKA